MFGKGLPLGCQAFWGQCDAIFCLIFLAKKMLSTQHPCLLSSIYHISIMNVISRQQPPLGCISMVVAETVCIQIPQLIPKVETHNIFL